MKVIDPTTTPDTDRASFGTEDALKWLIDQREKLEDTVDEFLICAEGATDKRLAAIFRDRAATWAERAGMLAEAACAVRADSLRGALIQTEMLFRLKVRGEEALFQKAADTALPSIFGAVSAALGDEDTRLCPAIIDPMEDNPCEIGDEWRDRVRAETELEEFKRKLDAA